MTEPPRGRVERLAVAEGGAMRMMGAADHMREVMGPFGPDNSMRQAVMTVWRFLPDAERSPEAVEREARRLLERAIRDLREDTEAFA
ncbi:MAG: hypothetical protein ACRDHF_08215 [Tepidiformaceae bacterium]